MVGPEAQVRREPDGYLKCKRCEKMRRIARTLPDRVADLSRKIVMQRDHVEHLERRAREAREELDRDIKIMENLQVQITRYRAEGLL